MGKTLFALFALTILSLQMGINEAIAQTYEYETVEGDPLGTKIYTLKNGLRVYMSVNRDEPRIQTFIATRAGSKNDPADATGLAHYLEHMLFKGSSKIGALEWEKEQKLLKQISDLYEEHRKAKPEDRAAIYKKIDEISSEAAKLVAANEYDKMISSLGAKGTNAFTSLDRTVYVNDIPSNELEKWLKVESERFQELVLRLFHTELEAVYEEFNIGQSNDGRKVFREFMSGLLPDHPYGTQTTIGTGEHLKTPSMEKIHAYFNKYYVPNNMAIILSGDFEPDEVVALVEKYFGGYEKQDLEKWEIKKQAPITSPVVKEVFGVEKAVLDIGWRLPGAGSDEALKAQLISQLLYNGKAGLIDINLAQSQKVGQETYAFSWSASDFSFFGLYGSPREGQSLEEVRDLLLEQLELVKKGEFEDWMLEAIINNLEFNAIRGMESNRGRAYSMLDAFIFDIPWGDFQSKFKRMRELTKQDLVDFAKANFTDKNYVVVYKREGEDKNLYEVEKPSITPVEVNREVVSEFKQGFDKMESPRQKPLFLDYDAQITTKTFKSGFYIDLIQKPNSEAFDVFYVLPAGTDNDKLLPLAMRYLPFLGTDKLSPGELKQEFFKLGVDYRTYTEADVTYIHLYGLSRSLEKGMALFEDFLVNVKADEDVLRNLVSDIKKEREDAKKDKRAILYQAMYSYGRYGNESPFKNRLSAKELDALKGKDLIAKINEVTSYEHSMFYHGNLDMRGFSKVVKSNHKLEKSLKTYPEASKFEELATDKNKVIFVNFEGMAQAEIFMISKGTPQFNREEMSMSRLYNEYFGSGLSSIVFQEIRESRALAYSAWVSSSTPRYQHEAHYLRAFVGTQTDKLSQAVPAMLEIINDMPVSEAQIMQATDAILKKIESERITKSAIYWSAQRSKKRGVNEDLRKDAYDKYKSLADKGNNSAVVDALKEYHETKIKDRKFTFMVLGDEEKIDMEYLKTLGDVEILTIEEAFGY